MDGTRGRIADFGIVERLQKHPLHELSSRSRHQNLPGFGDNWIVWSQWKNTTGIPVSSFKTKWVVPAEPLAADDQLLYVFNGIQNSAMIYQPVLQWGTSPAGGGGSWAVASWYVNGDDGDAFHSDLVPVQRGEILVGIITLIAQTGGALDYNCEFQNIKGTALAIQGVDEMPWCVETLEVYGIDRVDNYPTRQIKMQSIELRLGAAPANLVWSVWAPVTDAGQAVRVIDESTSGGGEVDLYCFGTKTIAFIPNTKGRIELFYTSVGDGIYRKFLESMPNNWSADEPIVSND